MMTKQNTFMISFLSSKHTKLLYISLVLSVILALIATIFYFIAPPQIPLFYSLSQPEQQLVQKEGIFILPTVALVSLLTTLALLSYAKNLDSVISTLILWSQIIMQSLLLVVTIRILVIIS